MPETKQTANETQVGGDHYRAPIQHWDYVEANGLGYLEGCATKYATRNRKKHDDPEVDLKKARHYIEKLLELHRSGGGAADVFWRLPLIRYFEPARWRRRFNRGGVIRITPEEFAKANNLSYMEYQVVRALTLWKTADDLWMAKMFVDDLLLDLELSVERNLS